MAGGRRGGPSLAELEAGVRAGDRVLLARAITLIESEHPDHRARADALLDALLPHTGGALRLGITGSPGVGKSTLIETLGLELVQGGKRLAVLAVDPSSTVSRGSILGDKTRMTHLSRHPGAFIRPSPSGGSLGGVARKTREALLLCEAAGFEVVLVETVGVGQSETAVRALVDLFVLLVQPGAGDELQGIKKGVVELADLLVVTKADGEGRERAARARADYRAALHYLAREEAPAEVLSCSALAGEGITELWQTVEALAQQRKARGTFEARRRQQALAWMKTLIQEQLERRFYAHPKVAALLPDLENQVVSGKTHPGQAARTLLSATDPEN